MDIEELTLKLLSLDTQNSDSNVTKFLGETRQLIDFCASVLKQSSNIVVNVQSYDIKSAEGVILRKNRANLIAKLATPVLDKPTVMLQGHVDTVPFQSEAGQLQLGWDSKPFGEVRDGLIYGRGAGDMKGPVAAMIAAFLELATRHDLKYNPILLLTSDEEANGFAGIKNYLSMNKENIAFAICGDGEDFLIADRFKGALSYNITFEGVSCHGSRPWLGASAVHAAIPTLQNLYALVSKVSDIKNPGFEGQDEHTTHSTMNIGKIEGGTKVNTVADRCTIEFEMRLVQDAAQYLQLIQNNIISTIPVGLPSGVKFTHKKNFAFEPMTVPNNVYSDGLEDCVSHVRGIPAKRGITHGFTEAYFLNEGGITTVVFGPTSPGHHGANERVLLKDLKVLRDVYVAYFTK